MFAQRDFTVVPFRIWDNTTGSSKSGGDPLRFVYTRVKPRYSHSFCFSKSSVNGSPMLKPIATLPTIEFGIRASSSISSIVIWSICWKSDIVTWCQIERSSEWFVKAVNHAPCCIGKDWSEKRKAWVAFAKSEYKNKFRNTYHGLYSRLPWTTSTSWSTVIGSRAKTSAALILYSRRIWATNFSGSGPSIVCGTVEANRTPPPDFRTDSVTSGGRWFKRMPTVSSSLSRISLCFCNPSLPASRTIRIASAERATAITSFPLPAPCAAPSMTEKIAEMLAVYLWAHFPLKWLPQATLTSSVKMWSNETCTRENQVTVSNRSNRIYILTYGKSRTCILDPL